MSALENLRAGKPDCPSDFALDALHANEAGERAPVLQQHVSSCEVCTARMAERAQGFAAFAEVDSRVLLARIRQRADEPQRPWWSRLLPIGVVLAAAAMMVFIWPTTSPVGDTRLKGSAALRVFKLTQGHPQEVNAGDTLKSGDSLRFVVNLPAAGHVGIVDLDGSGAVTTIFPSTAREQTHLGPGSGIELPGAVSLDTTPGDEAFHLVRCAERASLDSCRAVDSRELRCDDSCEVTPFVIHKTVQ